MGGRPPKPTALKILQGDFDKNPQRRNRDEPTPEAIVPPCPEWLKGNARREWTRVTKEMSDMNVMTMADRESVEQYCILYGQWRDMVRTVSRDGALVEGRGGDLVETAASKSSRALSAEILKYLVQFGLTPAARTRIHVQKATPPTRMRRVREG